MPEKPSFVESERDLSRYPGRIPGAIIAAVMACATLLAFAVAIVDSWSGGEKQLLLGPWISQELVTAATAVAFALLTLALLLIDAPRGWLVPMILGRIAAIVGLLGAAGFAFLISGSTFTPLLVDGCESGYVVHERSFLFLSQSTVYERDGLLATEVAHAGADDGYHPFADGAYIAVREGDDVEVWYSNQRTYGGGFAAAGDASITLPALTASDCAG